MALAVLSSNPAKKDTAKAQFENRLRLIAEKNSSIKYKQLVLEKYDIWRLGCDYLVLRTYDNHYTVHTNGNIEHYEVKEQKYKEVKFECTDIEFIINILENKTNVKA